MTDRDQAKLKEALDQIRLLTDNLEELRAEVAALRISCCRDAIRTDGNNGGTVVPSFSGYGERIRRFMSFRPRTVCVSGGDYRLRARDPKDQGGLPCRPSRAKVRQVGPFGYLRGLFARAEPVSRGCQDCPGGSLSARNSDSRPGGEPEAEAITTCGSDSCFDGTSSTWPVQTGQPEVSEVAVAAGDRKSRVTTEYVQTEPFFVIVKVCGPETEYTRDPRSNRANQSTLGSSSNGPVPGNSKGSRIEPRGSTGRYWRSSVVNSHARGSCKVSGRRVARCNRRSSISIEPEVSRDHEPTRDCKRSERDRAHGWFRRSKGDSDENFPVNEKNYACHSSGISRTSVKTSMTDFPWDYCKRNRKFSSRYA